MNLEIERLELGPWPMNCYLVRCPVSGQLAVVDPGADPQTILQAIEADSVCCIMLTHGHPDHVGALDAIREATGVPVGIHPADAEEYGVQADFPLLPSSQVEVGRGRVTVVYVPGHTPGSVCLRVGERALVGDAIFPGGPGHTTSPEALAQSLESLARYVFAWPDGIELYPGHGSSTTVGAERESFMAFLAADRPADLHGDVAWR